METTRKNSRLAAGLLALLLGFIGIPGIHKFYLGYTNAGLIMLLGGWIGGVITCGLAWVVMSIISIIEGIMYLCLTDEEFDVRHNQGRTPWF